MDPALIEAPSSCIPLLGNALTDVRGRQMHHDE
jgi:hypothetical protein